jgi:hypothetical protein
MSLWWARMRHRSFCRGTCLGHRYWIHPGYPSHERQFGRAMTYYGEQQT